MRDPLRTLGTEVRKIVSAGLVAGDDLPTILRRVSDYFDAIDLADELRTVLVTQASEQYEWVAARLLAGADHAELLEIFESAGADFARIKGEVEQAIVDEIVRGVRSGTSTDDLENILQRKFSHSRHQARTVVNTALLGINRTQTMQNAGAAGVKKFRYVGPSPDRAFCREHYKKVYTLDQINGLSNDQIGPVRLYCGGYNCRHRWLPIAD